MKEQKGITLVALIITIIVMLILVAVTVGVIVNSDLIGQTERAKNAYEGVDNDLANIGSKANLIENKQTIEYYVNRAENAVGITTNEAGA